MHQQAQDSQTCKLTLSSAMKKRKTKKTLNTEHTQTDVTNPFCECEHTADQEVGTVQSPWASASVQRLFSV